MSIKDCGRLFQATMARGTKLNLNTFVRAMGTPRANEMFSVLVMSLAVGCGQVVTKTR